MWDVENLFVVGLLSCMVFMACGSILMVTMAYLLWRARRCAHCGRPS